MLIPPTQTAYLLQKIVNLEVHLQDWFVSTFEVQGDNESAWCRGDDHEENVLASVA